MRLVTILALCLAVAGCSPDDDGHRGAGGMSRLVFAVHDEHNSMDPQMISWVSDGRIANCLYEPLVKYNAIDLSIEPGVAESWAVSDDKLTYTFHLRDTAKWSNGDPVTAGDFVYAWRRSLLPETAAQYVMLMYHIDGAEAFFNWRKDQLRDKPASPTDMWQAARQRFEDTVAIDAPDDRTLVVKLKQPTPYFLEMCAFVTFMPNHVPSVEANLQLNSETGAFEDITSDYWLNPQRLITNGPYILVGREFKKHVRMDPNLHYWDRASVANGGIEERIVSEAQAAILAYQNGDIHWLPALPSALPITVELVRQHRPDVHTIDMAGVYFYNFNCQDKLNDGSPNPLSDVKLRRALSMAIDRETIVTKVTRLNNPPGTTFVPQGALADYAPPVDSAAGFDPAQARKLLAETGYPGGKGLTGLSILYNSDHGHEIVAQAIKRMWQEHLGVGVELQGMEVRRFSSRLRNHDFTISRASWFGDYRDPTTWLDKMATGNGNNDCNYSNPRYDALLARAAGETDETARLELLRDAEAMMLQDSPMAMIYQYITVTLYDPAKVKHLDHNPWNVWRLDRVQIMP
jgi:oligopeptide transport system substrate-binding protein